MDAGREQAFRESGERVCIVVCALQDDALVQEGGGVEGCQYGITSSVLLSTCPLVALLPLSMIGLPCRLQQPDLRTVVIQMKPNAPLR